MKSDSTRFGLVSRARRQANASNRCTTCNTQLPRSWKMNSVPRGERVEVMGTVCGLASLPPELLAHAFSFAIFGDPRARHTMFLRHSTPITCLSPLPERHTLNAPTSGVRLSAMAFTPEMELVRACLDRSQNAPLDVFLNLYTNEIDSKKKRDIRV